MRVVDVTQWYAPASGGIRTYLRAKARWAAAAGTFHAAVVPGATPGEDTVDASRVVRVRGRTPGPGWGYRVVLRPRGVLDALEALRPDVVVLHDAVAFPRTVARWAARRGVPLAMVCHSDLALAARGLAAPVAGPAAAVLSWVQRRGAAAPDLLLVASRATEQRVRRFARGRVERVPLGVDLDVFAGARPSRELRASLAPPGMPLLLYAGRLSHEKRVDLLPKVLTHLPEARLAVAGGGAAEAGLMRRAARLGVLGRMAFLGHVADRHELATLMATADCFVHPNPEEPFGLAPLEALAAGCRVVAPDAAGSRETLAGRGAVLVTPGDAAALAAGVRGALTRPRPRPAVDDLAWERTFRREWDLYRELAGAA
ncbi:MAG: glycosyltransferase [Actinomycetota bacterium]